MTGWTVKNENVKNKQTTNNKMTTVTAWEEVDDHTATMISRRRRRRQRQKVEAAVAMLTNCKTRRMRRKRTRSFGSPHMSRQRNTPRLVLAQLILVLLLDPWTTKIISSSASAADADLLYNDYEYEYDYDYNNDGHHHLFVDDNSNNPPKSATTRIVNGQDVLDGSTASFFVRPSTKSIANGVCGAALIHNDIIVTAAHCVDVFIDDVADVDAGNNGSADGSGGGNVVGAVSLYNPTTNDFTNWRQIDWYRIHPNHISQQQQQRPHARQNYDDEEETPPPGNSPNQTSQINYDLMLMRLTYPVDPTKIKPIEINTDMNEPSVTSSDGGGEGGGILQAFGIGRTDPNSSSTTAATATTTTSNIKQQPLLQVGKFVPISNLECRSRVVTLNQDAADAIQDDVICADPFDEESVCKGDSGGPVTNLEGNKLIGIVVFGHGCTADQIPDGFGRMSFYAGWIQDQICEVSRVRSNLDYCPQSSSSSSPSFSPSTRMTSSPTFSPTTEIPLSSLTSVRPTNEIKFPTISTTESPSSSPTFLLSSPSPPPAVAAVAAADEEEEETSATSIDLTQISNFRDDSTKLSSTILSRERIRTITGPGLTSRNNNHSTTTEQNHHQQQQQQDNEEKGDGGGRRRERQRRGRRTLRGFVSL